MIEKLDKLVGGTKGVLTGEQILILTELAGMAPPPHEVELSSTPNVSLKEKIFGWEDE